MLTETLFLIWASTAVLAKNPWTYPHSALYTRELTFVVVSVTLTECI
jgi:hypothetical protein